MRLLRTPSISSYSSASDRRAHSSTLSSRGRLGRSTVVVTALRPPFLCWRQYTDFGRWTESRERTRLDRGHVGSVAQSYRSAALFLLLHFPSDMLHSFVQ